jgi:Fur family ferric uptake transcriptional regulator
MSATARRMTPQRAEILAELRAAHDHPTAAELYDRLRPRLPRLSLGTVYRNLDVLAAQGLAAKLAGNGAEARYDGMIDPHDHARCRCCGAVADIPSQGGDGAIELPEGFLVECRRLEYVGLCAGCRAEGGLEAPIAHH